MSAKAARRTENQKIVLVTGGTGFLATYCILSLASQGYRIRTTVRSLKREKEVRKILRKGGIPPGYELSFFETDLTRDEGWKEALSGCDYVLHVASPYPPEQPKNENELIVPAREGNLRVLTAAKNAGVKRVVMTSSFAAIGYGVSPVNKLFTENDWTDLRRKIDPYIKSKTLAEQAAWDFISREGGGMELTVINPTGIFGPVLGPDYSSSVDIVKKMLEGSIMRVPKIWYSIADVRDVAEIHLNAMLDPAAAGQRFIATSGNPLSMHQIATILKEGAMEYATQIPGKEMSNWMIRLTSLFVPDIRSIVPNLGIIRQASYEKAHTMLHWNPRPAEETIMDTARSLIRLHLVKVKGVY